MQGRLGQPPVARPEWRLTEQGGREKVGIDPTDPSSHETPLFEKVQHFVIGGADRHRKRRQEIEDLASVLEIAACELSDDERVNEHESLVQDLREGGQPSPQMLHPD